MTKHKSRRAPHITQAQIDMGVKPSRLRVVPFPPAPPYEVVNARISADWEAPSCEGPTLLERAQKIAAEKVKPADVTVYDSFEWIEYPPKKARRRRWTSLLVPAAILLGLALLWLLV